MLNRQLQGDYMQKIYIAHPFGGLKENKEKVEKIIRHILDRTPDMVPISPIHALGWLYNDVPYDKGMEWCYRLLDGCDCIIMCPGWQDSKGCRLEYEYAKKHNIPIYFLGDEL